MAIQEKYHIWQFTDLPFGLWAHEGTKNTVLRAFPVKQTSKKNFISSQVKPCFFSRQSPAWSHPQPPSKEPTTHQCCPQASPDISRKSQKSPQERFLRHYVVQRDLGQKTIASEKNRIMLCQMSDGRASPRHRKGWVQWK